jgi:hypothetical protein
LESYNEVVALADRLWKKMGLASHLIGLYCLALNQGMNNG